MLGGSFWTVWRRWSGTKMHLTVGIMDRSKSSIPHEYLWNWIISRRCSHSPLAWRLSPCPSYSALNTPPPNFEEILYVFPRVPNCRYTFEFVRGLLLGLHMNFCRYSSKISHSNIYAVSELIADIFGCGQSSDEGTYVFSSNLSIDKLRISFRIRFEKRMCWLEI